MRTQGEHSVMVNGYTYIISFEPHEGCRKYLYYDKVGKPGFVYCNFDPRYDSNIFKDSFKSIKMLGTLMLSLSPVVLISFSTISIVFTVLLATLLLPISIIFIVVGKKNIQLSDFIQNAVPIKEGIALVKCEYCRGTYDGHKEYECCPRCGAPITASQIVNADENGGI